MENQHEQIKGYRQFTPEEISLINLVKEKGAELEELCVMLAAQAQLNLDVNSIEYQDASRWVAVGKTHIQQGLMAWTRSVARPEAF